MVSLPHTPNFGGGNVARRALTTTATELKGYRKVTRSPRRSSVRNCHAMLPTFPTHSVTAPQGPITRP
ncbi:hypothetical protein GCM10010255_76890 [Streptomyces coeruleofuscus]|uniref:Uncharacterized protein n=1 Tax=Streptomyces coeruleofuscus TaxID=66879 RepID=A0ABN3J7P8_9ACTN